MNENETSKPGAVEPAHKEAPQPYDFNNPMILSRAEMRSLNAGHEEFAQSLCSLLSTYLRMDFGLRLAKVETVSFQSVLQAAPNPAHLVVFRLEPFQAGCLLQIDPSFGMSMVDRLMGGPGMVAAEAHRELTEIEIALLDQAIELILGEWCGHWKQETGLRATILSHESNTRFLQICPPKTLMLVFCFNVTMGETMGTMQLIAPYRMLEPLIRRGAGASEAAVEPEKKPKLPLWDGRLQHVSLPLSARWGVMDMPARRLSSLRVGEFLELSSFLPEQVELRVANMTKFTGRLGQQGKNWAVEIMSVKNS